MFAAPRDPALRVQVVAGGQAVGVGAVHGSDLQCGGGGGLGVLAKASAGNLARQLQAAALGNAALVQTHHGVGLQLLDELQVVRDNDEGRALRARRCCTRASTARTPSTSRPESISSSSARRGRSRASCSSSLRLRSPPKSLR